MVTARLQDKCTAVNAPKSSELQKGVRNYNSEHNRFF